MRHDHVVDVAARRASYHHQMARLGTVHGVQGDAPVEGDEAAAVLHRERQQIDVCDLIWPEIGLRINPFVVAQ